MRGQYRLKSHSKIMVVRGHSPCHIGSLGSWKQTAAPGDARISDAASAD